MVNVLKFCTPFSEKKWHVQTQIRLLLMSSLIRVYTVCDSSNTVCHSTKFLIKTEKKAKFRETRGPRATGRSPEWHSHCRYADVMHIFQFLSSQLMKRSSFKQFFILKKKIYGMPVNWAWSFEQTLNGSQLGFTIGTILAFYDLRVTPMLPTVSSQLVFQFRRRGEK